MQSKGQLLFKAKTMIIHNIRSRTIFTRDDLYRFISLSPNVEQSTDYLIALRTLTETRYIDWLEEPDNKSFIPKVPITMNSVWDITSIPPNEFVSDRQIYPIEGSEQRFTCPNCSGVGEVVRICYSCNGSGREVCLQCAGSGIISCYSCNGTGTRRDFNLNRLEKCSYCDGKGKEICSSCGGQGGRVCFRCDGTGRVVETCRRCLGVGRLIRYKAIICDFKPHEFTETISRWNLPFKQLKSAEASQVWEMPVRANLPLNLQGHPVEVQSATNSLVQQMVSLQSGDTRIVRSVLSIKAIPVARITFRLHNVPGEAWLLGKDFKQVYLPKVPLTFETWFRLKDWVSVGLTAGCFFGFFAFRSHHPFVNSVS